MNKFGVMTTLDLQSLSDAERGVLRLLGEGHTVKSIALLTGRSAHSVNERLRDARRKTGSGSSRELARLLREQETRDNDLGVAIWKADAASNADAAGQTRRSSKGLIMIPFFAVGVLAFSLVIDRPQQTPPAADPALDQAAGPPGHEPHDLRARMLDEGRDERWATSAESQLRARYAAISGVEPGPKVSCARTLCEVIGVIKTGSDPQVNKVMQVLQGPALHADLAKAGFTSDTQAFGGSVGPGKGNRFAAFWERAKQ